MNLYTLPLILPLLYLIGSGGCKEKGERGQTLFKIRDVSYQSWVISPEEHGTELFIYLEDIDPGVDFVSATFRGITIPLNSVTEEGKTILKGHIIFGESVLDNPDYKVTNKENSINYLYLGSEKVYLLKDIRRLPNKIGNSQ